MVPLLISNDFCVAKIPTQNSKFVTHNSKTASVVFPEKKLTRKVNSYVEIQL